MIPKIVHMVLFQVVWFVCVLSGKHQRPEIAVAASILMVWVGLRTTGSRPLEMLRLLGAVVVVGFVADSLNLVIGVFALNGTPRYPHVCPLWLAALWAAFGTTLRGPLSWLAGRYWLSAALGSVAGAGSYLAGARLGAVTLNPDWLFSTAVLVVMWAALMPLLIWLAHGGCLAPRQQEKAS